MISGKRVIGLDYLWNIPVGYLAILMAFGSVAVFLSRIIPARLLLRFIVFGAAFMASFGWISLAVKGLHAAAAATLAAGIAVQLSSSAGRHAHFLNFVVRRTVPWLALVVAVTAGGAFVWPRWTESRAVAALPKPPEQAPNVLFIVLDTVRAKSLSLYGYGRPTSPNLERFAREGVVFSHAFSASPWTLPSHGSMFTGRWPHELTADWLTPIDGTHPTLAEALSSAGYRTAGFIANTTYCQAEYGLARGFSHYEDHPHSLMRALFTTAFGTAVNKSVSLSRLFGLSGRVSLKSAARLNGDFLRWIDRRPADRPFFAFLNYYDAHAPYEAPPDVARRFGATPLRGDIWSRKLDQWAPDEVRELNDAYDAAIGYLDDQLGVLFTALRDRKLFEDTLVIITSDHGEQFGEHGLLEHANSLYLPLLHVPLVIVWPGHAPAAARVETFVTLRDLASTVMALTGQQHAMQFPGTPLGPLWAERAGTSVGAGAPFLAEVNQAYDAYPNSYPARKGRMMSLFFGTRHYIRNLGNNREELYDLATDPGEAVDLSAGQPQLLKESRTLIETVIGKSR
jgi:arylsulfatase A-like enzyme